MHRALIIVALGLAAACGPHYQTVSLVNRTSRPIVELYVYPQGSANRGASRGTLAPNASMKLSIPQGAVEVLAVSAMIKHDDNTRETPTVSRGLELTHPFEVIFYDAGEKPVEVDHPGVIGAMFRLDKTEPAPEPPPAEAP